MAKKKQTTGNCKYCGQSMIIYLPEGWDPEDKAQEDYDQLATEQCECEQALTEEERNQKKASAVKRMMEFYDDRIGVIKGRTPEEMAEVDKIMAQRDLMVKVIQDVAEDNVYAAQVQISQAEVFSVAIKKNGDLQVKRIYKGVEEWMF